jgi:glycerophosphoryl diester phosphodiesterase
MLVIGHRGAAGLAHENTISSLQAAVKAGVQMVEVDLRSTLDGQVVLAHDPTLARTHDDRRRLSRMTLAQVREVGKREGREIPTLEEFLRAASLPVNLELKEPGMEAQVVSAIRTFPHKVLVSSSYPDVLKKIRALDGNLPLGLIVGPKAGILLPMLISMTGKVNLHSIHPVHNLVTPLTMRIMRRTGAKVYAWTVNDVHDLQLMRGHGVDGIFTDYPNIIT